MLLKWMTLLLVVAIASALLAFTGVAGSFAAVAQVFFFLSLFALVALFVAAATQKPGSQEDVKRDPFFKKEREQGP